MLREKSACFSKIMALALFFFLPIGQEGCHRAVVRSDNSPAPPAQEQRAFDYRGLIDKLRAQGAKVEAGDEVSQPFFSVKGRSVSIGDEAVQVFEYKTAGDAEAEAKSVDPHGTKVGTSIINWVSPPHFFKGGKLIVIYVGNDAAKMKILESVLGKQFAGE